MNKNILFFVCIWALNSNSLFSMASQASLDFYCILARLENQNSSFEVYSEAETRQEAASQLEAFIKSNGYEKFVILNETNQSKKVATALAQETTQTK